MYILHPWAAHCYETHLTEEVPSLLVPRVCLSQFRQTLREASSEQNVENRSGSFLRETDRIPSAIESQSESGSSKIERQRSKVKCDTLQSCTCAGTDRIFRKYLWKIYVSMRVRVGR